MTTSTCKVKKWDLIETNITSLGQEIEDLCNSGEVETIQTFVFGRWLVLISIFKTEANKEV